MMDKAERTEKVFEAAVKVFARYGFKKATVEDIAAELGMTKGNLYQYAENKKDLYEKVLDHELRKWQSYAKAAMDKESMAEGKIVAYTNSGYSYLCVNEQLRQIIISDPSVFPISSGDDRFHAINEESMGIFKTLIKKGIKDKVFRKVDADHLAELLYSVYVMFVIKTYVRSEITSPEKMLAAGLDLVLNGIRSRPDEKEQRIKKPR